MKLIEAMKQIKDLLRKAEDLRGKVGKFCAYHSNETPTYPDQTKQISEWLQSHSDILKEILRLREAVQKTNLETSVGIEFDGKTATKSIAAWIHRRRDLADLDRKAWAKLTDRNLREGNLQTSQDKIVEVRIIRCFDPAQRDTRVEQHTTEPSVIDSRLEVVNAVTELIE